MMPLSILALTLTTGCAGQPRSPITGWWFAQPCERLAEKLTESGLGA